MKRWMAGLLSAILLCTALVGCMQEPPSDKSSDTSSTSSETAGPEKENTLMEYYHEDTVDFDLQLFPINVPTCDTDPISSRVIILSDNHYKTHDVGGYTDAERQEIMIDILLKENYDCVIFNGDFVTRNNYLKTADAGSAGDTWLQEFNEAYLGQLADAGKEYFVVNASHESMYGSEFEDIFGYENNYVVLVGTTAYICVDTYSGARTATGETRFADIPSAFVDEVEKLLAHGYVQNAFVVCHYPSDDQNILPNAQLERLVGLGKVAGLVTSHTHDRHILSRFGKPMIQTGHFWRGYTAQWCRGSGFKAFAPLNDSMVGTVTNCEQCGGTHKDYSATGTPWQYRVIEFTGSDTDYTLEAYMVFPEVAYGAWKCDGIDWPAFTQPYTEARPSFLGDDAPVDRSYIMVKDVKDTE